MTPQDAQPAFNDISSHITNNGGVPSQWYAGIASDWESRLFNDHSVPKADHAYIARRCTNDTASRNVEKALLELGCTGGPSGGDSGTVFVYAYIRIPGTTRE